MGSYYSFRQMDFGRKPNWYVLANRVSATIYSNGPSGKFTFLQRIDNKQGGMRESDLDSDKPGRGFSTAGGGVFRHSLDRRYQHHELVARKFAKRLGKFLDSALRKRAFGQLVLIAEPHFLGLLREAFPPAVKRVVEHEIKHRYRELSSERLHEQIQDAIIKVS